MRPLHGHIQKLSDVNGTNSIHSNLAKINLTLNISITNTIITNSDIVILKDIKHAHAVKMMQHRRGQTSEERIGAARMPIKVRRGEADSSMVE